MNRAEKRAIKFGEPFSLLRCTHKPYRVFVGIDAELEAAWQEYCSHTSPNPLHDSAWTESEIAPFFSYEPFEIGY